MNLELNANSQREMRDAFFDGAPGILVSGLVWATAAAVCLTLGAERGVVALLVGGALIHPVATVLEKALGRSAVSPKGNGLPVLAAASTVWLIVCCAMAYGLSRLHLEWFFPTMMATIGSRYLVFATLFGRSAYWIGGATLLLAGIGSFLAGLPPVHSAALGGVIEIVFAVAVFRHAGRRPAV